MYKEIMSDILSNIKTARTESALPVFEYEGYEGIEIEENNFSDIRGKNSRNTILFIDGGNNVILSSFNFSLQYVRVVGVMYSNNERKEIKRNEFYSSTTTKYEWGKIFYNTKIFPIKEKLFDSDLKFDSMSEELKEGRFRASVNKVAGMTRRLAEIRFAISLLDGLNEGDVVVLDGCLIATCDIEREILDELYTRAEEKKVVVAALTKTTRIFTTTGASIIDTLNSFNKKRWLYHPVFKISNESHKAAMYFVKLHEKADYTFRFEIFNKQKEEAEKVISILASNSKDAAFPGYPYGLITADRFARVTNNEAEYFRTRFMAETGFDIIKKSMKSTDMHDLLRGV